MNSIPGGSFNEWKPPVLYQDIPSRRFNPIGEHEVQHGEGHLQILHIQPYRTADYRIDGEVVVLMNIDGTATLLSSAPTGA